MKWQVHMEGDARTFPVRDRYDEAAQDAVDEGLAHWKMDNKLVFDDPDVEIIPLGDYNDEEGRDWDVGGWFIMAFVVMFLVAVGFGIAFIPRILP